MNPIRRALLDPRAVVLPLFAAGLLLGFARSANAQNNGNPPVVRIEQDWEIHVKYPDAAASVPRVTLWVKPDPALDYGFLVTVNYTDVPFYSPGGISVQGWDRDMLLGAKHHAVGVSPSREEKIHITTYMKVADGKIDFGVSKGKSPTFGDLSKVDLVVTGVPTNIRDFRNYNTRDSVDNIEYSLAPERLASVKINAVRLYDVTGKHVNLGSFVVPIPNQ